MKIILKYDDGTVFTSQDFDAVNGSDTDFENLVACVVADVRALRARDRADAKRVDAPRPIRVSKLVAEHILSASSSEKHRLSGIGKYLRPDDGARGYRTTVEGKVVELAFSRTWVDAQTNVTGAVAAVARRRYRQEHGLHPSVSIKVGPVEGPVPVLLEGA